MSRGLTDEDIGTFVGLSLSPDIAKELEDLCLRAGVPKCVGSEGFHVTLIYSRQALDGYTPTGMLEEEIVAKPLRYVTLSTRPRQLLLELQCEELVQRHEVTMAAHPEANYHHGDYVPHITLSYDIGSCFEAESMDWFSGDFSIPLIEEYMHDLIPAGVPRRRKKKGTDKVVELSLLVETEDVEGLAPRQKPRRRRVRKKKG